MNKIYDFYSKFKPKDVKEIYELSLGRGRFSDIQDIYSRIEILSTVLDNNELKPYAQTGSLSRELRNNWRNYENKAGLKHLIHDCLTYNTYIKSQLELMEHLGLEKIFPQTLPENSFFLSIKFKLKTPFISAADVSFYVIENPLKKEKVFKVPVISGSGWKGNLRWVMTKIFLLDKYQKLSVDEFADERLKLSLLFGPEKGLLENKSWTKFLDKLKLDAKENYGNKLKKWFNMQSNNSEPHFIGRLQFYPTLLNKMDLMVINPHDRITRTGKNPVYIECVPEGTEGKFSILYMPFDLIGRRVNIQDEMKNDIDRISKGIKEMLYKYGFSAKKTSGFGTTFSIEKENIKLIPESENLRSIVVKNLSEANNE